MKLIRIERLATLRWKNRHKLYVFLQTKALADCYYYYEAGKFDEFSYESRGKGNNSRRIWRLVILVDSIFNVLTQGIRFCGLDYLIRLRLESDFHVVRVVIKSKKDCYAIAFS